MSTTTYNYNETTSCRLESIQLKSKIKELIKENETLKRENESLIYALECEYIENNKLKENINVLHHDFIVLKEENQVMNFDFEQHKMTMKNNRYYIDNICILQDEKLTKEIDELNYYKEKYNQLWSETRNIFGKWHEKDYGEALNAITNFVNKNEIEMDKFSLHSMLIGKLSWWIEDIIKIVYDMALKKKRPEATSFHGMICQLENAGFFNKCQFIKCTNGTSEWKQKFRDIKRQRNHITHQTENEQWRDPTEITKMIESISTMIQIMIQ